MISAPRIEDETEAVCFDAEVHGKSVRVEVGREAIEGYLMVKSMSSEQRLDFVKRNRSQIVEHVRTYLREVPDVTGMIVGWDQLKFCR